VAELTLGMVLSREGRHSLLPTLRSQGPSYGRLTAFTSALHVATGLETRGHGLTSYRDLLPMLQRGELDLAWLPPILALQGINSQCAHPLVLPMRSGEAEYYSALFTRDTLDAPEQASQLHRVRVGWVDRTSSSGYQVIRAVLRSSGHELQELFGEELFLGSHDDVTRAVESGNVDVGATFAHIDTSGNLTRGGWGRTPVRILASAGPIPNDVLAAARGLPSEVQDQVSEALLHPSKRLAAAANELFGTTNFRAAEHHHFAALLELADYLDEAAE